MANDDKKEKTLTVAEKVLVDMINESRPPLTDAESTLLAEIQEIKDAGRTVEIPNELT